MENPESEHKISKYDHEILSGIIQDQCLYGEKDSKVDISEFRKTSTQVILSFILDGTTLNYTLPRGHFESLYRLKVIKNITETEIDEFE